MNRSAAVVCVAAALGLSSCAASLSSQPPSQKFAAGFWFWQWTNLGLARLESLLDVLYVHPYRGEWPREVPAANEYWVVHRHERQAVPDDKEVAIIAEQARRLAEAAQRRGIRLTGIQLDVDSPTAALPRYAEFLREVRRQLPQGFQLSITALLDWFRDGTSVAQVIREVDEFVPQFYDTADPRAKTAAIAAPIDAAKWSPIFNRYRKRFRVGISAFGRSRLVSSRPYADVYRDVMPIEIAIHPEFQLNSSRTAAGELVLDYRALRKNQIEQQEFVTGDTVEFILPMPEMVSAAVASVRRFGGYCAGVVFFRWSNDDRELGLRPEEVLRAAGLRDDQPQNWVHALDGQCAALKCSDLFLESGSPFSEESLRYRLRASTDLEYFLPQPGMPARMTGPKEIEVTLPPYCARGHLYLGRAVSAKAQEFVVEEMPK